MGDFDHNLEAGLSDPFSVFGSATTRWSLYEGEVAERPENALPAPIPPASAVTEAYGNDLKKTGHIKS